MPGGSVLSRFNFPATLRGLAGMGTVSGLYFASRNQTGFSSIQFSNWKNLAIGRFDPSMISPVGYDPSLVRSSTPRDQSSYACNPVADIYTNGHVYDYTSKTFTIGPAAMEQFKSAGQAAAIPMILSFAGGDGTLVRPEAEKANFVSDFEYTKSVLRSGNLPPDCEVNLGKSRIRVSDVVVTQRDGGFAFSMRATTTAQHLFDGNARWELQVDKEGSARTNISGSGKAILFAIDGANNCIAGTLWGTSADRLKSLCGAMEKDRDVIERSADHTELRANVAAQDAMPRNSQVQEHFLRAMNVASGPLIQLKASVVASDVASLKDGTTQNVRAFVNQVDVPAEADFVSPQEIYAVNESAAETANATQPLLQRDDLKDFVHPASVTPVNPGNEDEERKAREAREAEEKREAEMREREKQQKEQEEREKEEREQQERDRSHH